MQSSAQQATSDFAAGLERCFGARITSVEPVRGGANNRVYRMALDGEPYALKFYPTIEQDPRDRLRTEAQAARFLHAQGITQVPRLIRTDPVAGCALFTWVDGAIVDPINEDDLAQLLAFIERLVALRGVPGTEDFTLASDACLSAAETVRQIGARLRRLCNSANLTRPAVTLLHEAERALTELTAMAEEVYAQSRIPFDGDIDPDGRVLSPSDFGFHNALRRPNGALVILDLEYFGWDDPVKLAADFLLHPGMTLSSQHKADFLDGVRRLFSGRDAFDARLRVLYPLYALRWTMIIMNEFLPERWRRRVQAGETGRREDILACQLAKAADMLGHARSTGRAFPYDS